MARTSEARAFNSGWTKKFSIVSVKMSTRASNAARTHATSIWPNACNRLSLAMPNLRFVA
eukprot:11204936-Lingulodinium_polyedra.AAC.1